jgi:type I restriction enzyme M protein
MKRISDKWELEYETAYKEALADGLTEEEARAEAKRDEYHLFNLPKNTSGKPPQKCQRTNRTIQQSPKAIADGTPSSKMSWQRRFRSVCQQPRKRRNPPQLRGSSSARKTQPRQRRLQGDAYEWILRYFHPPKPKKAKSTPPEKSSNSSSNASNPKPMEAFMTLLVARRMLIEASNSRTKYGYEESAKLYIGLAKK